MTRMAKVTPKLKKKPMIKMPTSPKPKKQTTTSLQTIIPSQPIKSLSKWDDAYPYIEEVYKINNELIQIPKYFSSADKDTVEYEKFLYEVVRSNNLPVFVKTNLKKIRKLIDKEKHHRSKMIEKLSKEQKQAFTSYFQNELYFDKGIVGEYFEHEIEKVYVHYLRAYCETSMYESRVRIGNKKRKDLLQKYNIPAV